MDTRRYRTLSALAVASLAAAALAGCGAGVGTSTAHTASSGAVGTPSISPVPASPAPSAPAGAPSTGGRATPGPGRTGATGGGATGTGTAKPVPLSSLTCGGPATVPGTLPDRDWAEAASCPVAGSRPGDGGPVNQPGVPVVKHGNLAPLVSALHQPDAPRSHGMCPDYRILMPTFWLVDGTGKAYQPHIPVNSCGQPSAAVVSALQALGLA
ncbi:hypothetical protein [Rugosimonospora africana]|uniref:Uncharacterized protein n=1 Tax=Rugosimonospora africana TaxID=556532 RepID=A0A8J3VUU3_9ACTN|nr:hypothetical protein [Rugosimonospora africana]GIH19224.1 hypothetical protein Raf01_73960 [Rugosimonospora africana]